MGDVAYRLRSRRAAADLRRASRLRARLTALARSCLAEATAACLEAIIACTSGLRHREDAVDWSSGGSREVGAARTPHPQRVPGGTRFLSYEGTPNRPNGHTMRTSRAKIARRGTRPNARLSSA